MFVELGAGVGLASCVASRCFPRAHVFATDVAEGALRLCSTNLKTATSQEKLVHVRALDWADAASVSPAGWAEADWTTIQGATGLVLLAADPIYDDDVTHLFVTHLAAWLWRFPKAVCLIAFEKRINMEPTNPGVPVAHEVEHFLNVLEENRLQIAAVLDVDSLPAAFEYDRGPSQFLEIVWIRPKEK